MRFISTLGVDREFCVKLKIEVGSIRVVNTPRCNNHHVSPYVITYATLCKVQLESLEIC